MEAIRMKRIPSLLLMLLSMVAVSVHVEAETLRGLEVSGERYTWPYAFDADLSDTAVAIHIKVNWVPAAAVTWPELEGARRRWVNGILRVWDNRYQLVTPEGRAYPIRITISSAVPEPHHEVIVRRSGRGTDELNWNLSDSAEYAAHEFGHMIGAFDGYPGGALAPDPGGRHTGIMAGRTSGEALPQDYEKIRKWFEEQTGMTDIRLVPVSDRTDSMKGKGHSS